jgi:ABC-2 type transport system ATP-binding protein
MININDMSFGYPNNEKLFKNIALNIPVGGIYGLLGKNGSGKSSLLKILAGLIFPIEGSCRVIDHKPGEREPSFLEDIYYLPEDLFLPALTIETYVKFYAEFYHRFDHARLQSFIKEFDLQKNQLLNTFSQGQKKKFLIAFGLATNCRVFILDEPTNGLDIPSKAQFRKLLISSITDEKLFIISTHQVHDVENLIDEILVLDEGKIIFHESLLRITQKLAFTQQLAKPDQETIIYSEKLLGSYNTISQNQDNQDTQINLEILFNAILANQKKFQAIFAEGNPS